MVAERLQSSQSFKDHAVVFVHGYNTAFDYAVYRTAQIAYDLKFDGVPFLFSWPFSRQNGELHLRSRERRPVRAVPA